MTLAEQRGARSPTCTGTRSRKLAAVLAANPVIGEDGYDWSLNDVK
jgi:hypothetical protein